VKWLPRAELWYNTSLHSSPNCTSFQALYGVDPSPRLLPFLRPSEHQDSAEFLKEKQCFIEPLKQQLAKSQNRMKM
jgi:hypothetical protein